NRLITSKGLESLQTLSLVPGDEITDFGFYSLPNLRFTDFYAFTKIGVYWYDFDAGSFDSTPVYNLLPGTEDRMVILPWYDGLYVTKPHGKLIKIQHKTFKEI